MQYVVMMHAGAGPYTISSWPKSAIRAHIAHMKKISADLEEAGEFVAGIGLAPPNEAKLVRAGVNGVPITDGVFPETKEFLAGYWLVEVNSPERAYEIAARASAAPGSDGKPMNMPIEVRQALCKPPDELTAEEVQKL